MFSPLNSNDVRFGDPGSPNTEPMALGSPVCSPKSKATSSQNYLPPYLFGEVSTSPVGAATWSTPKQHNTSFPSTPSQHSSVSHYRDQQISFQSPASRSLINTPNAAKSGGPPVQGLLYTSTTPASSFHITQFDTTPKTPGRPTTETINNESILTPSKSFCLNSNSHMSPAQIDPFFTQGEALKNSDQLDESWVTVFGFPSASASFILQQFSQYGNIIEHKIHPTGNWMHIRYQSKLQAKKALSKNGKIFSGNIMIGVKPCIEMDLMESSKENSLMESSIVTRQDSFHSDIVEPIKPSLKNIRPLTQAYQSPNAQAQAVTPKSEGIVSKAFQYLWKL